jgi:hypothetical protein
VPIGVPVEPLQAATPHTVPAAIDRQTPLPSHVPLKPQGGVNGQPPCGSIPPAGTGAQVPADPTTLHDVQVAQVGTEQQTPSTQLPLSHSADAPQIWPSRFLPHEPLVHTFPAAQSPSTVQAARHAVPLQVYGVQVCIVAGLHAPAPSHIRASVPMVVPTGHTGAAHCVPASYSWQLPAPSQKPLVPQLAAP